MVGSRWWWPKSPSSSRFCVLCCYELTWALTPKSRTTQWSSRRPFHSLRPFRKNTVWLLTKWGETHEVSWFPSLSVGGTKTSCILLVPSSCPPGISPYILTRNYYFSWFNTLPSLGSFFFTDSPPLYRSLFHLSHPMASCCQLFLPPVLLLCWNAPHLHSHIWLTLLRLLITVKGAHSQKASTNRKLMAKVCFSEALCIITLWNDEMCVCVSVCGCLLPFNCFPSNQRGHCQVADLLKAVISHLHSLTQLFRWCVILNLFFFLSSISVKSLPSLMAAISFPLL